MGAWISGYGRMRQTLAAAALMLSVLAWPGPAGADIPAGSVSQVDAAFAAFEARAKEAQAHGGMPRWSVPEDRDVLARMLDPALLGAPPYSRKDLAAMDAIAGKARAVYGAYLGFARDAPTPEAMEEKALASQDELLHLDAFFIALEGAELTALADFVAHLKPGELTEVRLDGLRQMRLGILQTIAGALAMSSDAVRPENRELLLAALADNAEPIAAALPITTRAQLADAVRNVFASMPPADQARVQSFLKAMASTQCSGLCTLG